MKILAIDTAGPVVGVALLVDDVVQIRTERSVRGTEALLIPWALDLCGSAGIALADLDRIAVTLGPGAFTGVRVGVSTAIGLSIATGVGCVATTSLHARALRAGPRTLALLDARKGRVYAEAWDGARLRGPEDVSPADALGWLSAPFVATGEGAIVYADAVAAAGGTVAPEADSPAVDTLARLAARGALQPLDPLHVELCYVRAPDALPRPV